MYFHQIMSLVVFMLFALNSFRCCFPLSNEKQIESFPPCLLEVKGEVSHPGLYYYAYSPTINEFLNASGNAPGENIALSQNSRKTLSTGTVLWVQKTRKGLRVVQFPLEGKKKILLGIPINLNTATLNDLSSLPGIGPSISGKVIAYRKAHGIFSKVEDIKAVHGFGEKRFRKIEKYLTVKTEML